MDEKKIFHIYNQTKKTKQNKTKQNKKKKKKKKPYFAYKNLP